jgi:hypothetical protein
MKTRHDLEFLFLKMRPSGKLRIAALLVWSAATDLVCDSIIWLLGGSKR